MKLVFYSLVLNHHQACVADEFYHILGEDYTFVETAECHDQKGATEDYSMRPYLLRAWESEENWNKAMELAETAEVCVCAGFEALPFEKARMQKGLLTFDMGERLLKRGWLNLLSPRILKMVMAYHLGRWNKKPIYKLCCSSFARKDQEKLWSYRDRCYKWGYFVDVPKVYAGQNRIPNKEEAPFVRFMWCARLLQLKHPELVIKMSQKLKTKGYNFVVDIYGDEGNASSSEEVYSLENLKHLAESLGVDDVVRFHGSKHNAEIIEAMKEHDVFLFTSDNREGWGVVVNESMSCGCAVISSDAIGSTEYLVKDKNNGFSFCNCDVESLTEKAEWMLTHPVELEDMKQNAYRQMQEVWSPQNAAKSLLLLIEDLKNGRDTSIPSGPCSKA